MKRLTLILFIAVSTCGLAQNDTTAIKTVINKLFEGMKTGDSALVASTFHPDVKMQTIFTTKTGETKLHTGSLIEFLNAVGSDHEGTWIEKLISVSIQEDKIMASAWTPYEFFVDDTFIHCGVNSFQLVKLDDKWVISYLIDTRRKLGCKD